MNDRLSDEELAEVEEDNPCVYAGTEGECWQDEDAEEWCETCVTRLLAAEVRELRADNEHLNRSLQWLKRKAKE